VAAESRAGVGIPVPSSARTVTRRAICAWSVCVKHWGLTPNAARAGSDPSTDSAPIRTQPSRLREGRAAPRRQRCIDPREQRGDGEALVRRRVRAEPPARLLKLPAPPHLVPARLLVRGDGDVDEALVEVPLRRRRGAPQGLQQLVRGEAVAGSYQRQSGADGGQVDDS